MYLIKQKVTEIKQTDIYQHIQTCGQICYKNSNKSSHDLDNVLPDAPAKGYVKRLTLAKHNTILEHATVYLDTMNESVARIYEHNPYSFLRCYLDGNIMRYAITTNYRVLFESGRISDLRYKTKTPIFNVKRRTFWIVTDKAILGELSKHRVLSCDAESTRACNYGSKEFNSELTVIEPYWLDGKEDSNLFTCWNAAMDQCENSYRALINMGCSAQEARSVLPTSLKCDVIMTGTEDQWKDFIKIREASIAHPQAQEIAKAIKNLL